MRAYARAILVGWTVIFVSGGIALAHKNATGIVKKRMGLMKGIASEMKRLKPMVNGKTPYDVSVVQGAAKAISAHARDIGPTFPKGSAQHPSEASPKIWTEWEKFEASANDLQTHADALLAEAGKGVTVAKPLFASMTDTCKTCHQRYRVKRR